MQLTEANAVVILSNYGNMLVVWETERGDPILMNYTPDKPERFGLVLNVGWTRVLSDIHRMIANGWTPTKWPAKWGEWKRHAQTQS